MKQAIITGVTVGGLTALLLAIFVAAGALLPDRPMDLNARPEYIPGVTSGFH